MSSIGSLSSATSNSIRGYGGLASGLDRDTLIENMTYGTSSKIEQQELKKTALEWEQEIIRNISDKMLAFAEKYTATLTSSTNLFNANFWGKSDISVIGEFSKYVSISGMSNTADSVSILGVKQLAQNARWTSDSVNTGSKLESGTIRPDQTIDTENLAGKTLVITYNNKDYTVSIPSGESSDGYKYSYGTISDAADSINKALENCSLSNGKTLADVVKVGTDGDKFTFENISSEYGDGLTLKGGTALESMGFKEPDVDFTEMDFSAAKITGGNDADLITQTPFVDVIAGKQLTFTYNGTSASVTLPDKAELDQYGADTEALMKAVESSLEKQLADAFGKGRIDVELSGSAATGFELGFTTTKPEGGVDTSSVLSVSGNTSALDALGLESGASNRTNMNTKLSDLGIADGSKFKINDTEIEVKAGDTISSLMERINRESDVEVSYQQTADKFVFTAKADGASGEIRFDASTDSKLLGIFGIQVGADGTPSNGASVQGQDAVIAVKYGDSSDYVELVRGSNTFTLEGMTVSVSGKFGYDESTGQVDTSSEAVTFDAKLDTDKVVDTIKEMVTAFNEIVELVNKEVGTRPDRDYTPLTDAQKKELSEDEIETYEAKAKEGLLFNDSDLRNLSQRLRYIISAADQEALREIGISTSSSYSDNGKLVVDEAKLRAALESDPEKVEELFTKQASTDANGNTTGVNGIATNLKSVMYDYVNNLGNYGILINKAGSAKAPRSITDNYIYNQISEIDKKIAQLQDRLEAERDRYIKQFTSLETLISQMNSQSSWLSQFGAGY